MTTSPVIHKEFKNDSFRSAKVLDRLIRSKIFSSYQKIFQETTGLPLELTGVSDNEVTACRGSVNQNHFCKLLNQGNEGCKECLMAQRCLSAPESRGVQSIACFAGLQETAVPVSVGGTVIAQLKTGQIFHEDPEAAGFHDIVSSLESIETDPAALEKAYLETPVIEKQRYHAMITLLASFSLQLTKLANQIEFQEELEKEDVMSQVQDYIDANIQEPLNLERLADEFHMSTFHFCRKFKESLGLTLTEYLTQQRIDLAKDALRETDHRITDIAYDVGFQSLSQFNRSFHKLTGMAPSVFRRRYQQGIEQKKYA